MTIINIISCRDEIDEFIPPSEIDEDITPIPITSISLSDNELNIVEGDTVVINAATIPNNTTEDKTIIWSSSDTNIVTVSDKGIVNGVVKGSATITATSSANPDIKVTCTVNVINNIDNIITIKIFEDIKLNLASQYPSATLNPTGTITIRELNSNIEPDCNKDIFTTSCKFTGDRTNLFSIVNDVLNINASENKTNYENADGYFMAIFNTLGNNLKFNQIYEIYSDGGILDENKNQVKDIIGFFKTDSFPTNAHFKRLREHSEYTGIHNGIDFEVSASPFQARAQKDVPVTHKISGATNRNITGKHIGVAIYDSSIFTQTEDIGSAVVYSIMDDTRYLFGDIQYNTSKEGVFDNHATQMARYTLDFAPGVDIYNFGYRLIANDNEGVFKQLKKENLNYIEDESFNYISYGEYFMLAKQLGVNIFNHSGGKDLSKNDFDKLNEYIKDGGILNIGAGNEYDISNTFNDGNYKWKQKFLPYAINWTNKTGAIVILTSVLISDKGNYEGIRSSVGDLRYFTLTIQENGNGATSSAAASFSGILALMMEANEKYEAGFTSRQLVEILFQTATDIGDPGIDSFFGHGLVNIEDALNMVENKIAPTYKLYQDLPANINVTFN